MDRHSCVSAAVSVTIPTKYEHGSTRACAGAPATMGRRAPNPRRIKGLRSYTVEEISRLLGVHKHTVRNWIKEGLPTIDDRRPALILGSELRTFLERRRARAKHVCPAGTLFCLRCRSPRAPALEMVEYVPFEGGAGNIRALCPTCGCLMNRRATSAAFAVFRANLESTSRQALGRLCESARPSVDCAFEGIGGA